MPVEPTTAVEATAFARGETRPAFRRTMDAQCADFAVEPA
jgi:hypothetical protein